MVVALSIIISIAAVVIVGLVLMQSGKSHGLSGTIAGGAETFFGKENGKKADVILNKVTAVIVICFCVVLIVLYLVQPDPDTIQTPDLGLGNSQYYDSTTETEADTTEDTSTPDTSADTTAESTAETTAA
ncbi:MAG: preprotein translocase subunit SecG [Clostridia bacterium]|nr:preprotein translocase subunit SecG [Clostridia bacterium]